MASFWWQGTRGQTGAPRAPVSPNIPATSLPGTPNQLQGLAGALDSSQGSASATYSSGSTTRAPGPDELVENRITKLLAGTNPYVQNARTRGINFAAGRGLTNSGLAARSAEASAIQGALPIASQDAKTISDANAQNASFAQASAMFDKQQNVRPQELAGTSFAGLTGMEDEARRNFEREQNALDRELTRSGWTNQRGESDADRAFQREMTLGGREFQRGENETQRAYDLRMEQLRNDFTRSYGAETDARRFGYDQQAATTAWGRESSQRQTEMYTSLFGGAMGQVLGTLMSSPDLWGDPTAAQGFLDRNGSVIASLFQRFGIRPGGG